MISVDLSLYPFAPCHISYCPSVQYLYYILTYLLTAVLLTEKDLQRLAWLFVPGIKEVIAFKAVLAYRYLLPLMYVANTGMLWDFLFNFSMLIIHLTFYDL